MSEMDDQLVGRLAGWPVCPLARWPVGRLAGWPVGWFARWLVCPLAGWPVGRLARNNEHRINRPAGERDNGITKRIHAATF